MGEGPSSPHLPVTHPCMATAILVSLEKPRFGRTEATNSSEGKRQESEVFTLT